MERVAKDEEREHRINTEAIVDCYGPEEQAIGWFNYLEYRLMFPFKARCIDDRTVSLLSKGDEVEVVSMADEDDCMSEMFVMIEWMGRPLGVPLAQLAAVDTDETTEQAVGDWHYWLGRGYQLL